MAIGISFLNAQSLEDAVRFSFLNPISTGRSVGTGGALGAMGVDFGAFGSNPAGVGRLRYSEVALSIGIDHSSIQSQYQDGDSRPTSTNLKPTLNNAGLSFVNPGRRGKWKQRNFAMSINRLADFNRTIDITDQTAGSITDRFLDISNGLFPADLDMFEGRLAFDVLAIDTIPGSPTAYFSDLASTSTVTKSIQNTTRGSLNELQLTWGSNYDNKLMIGLGIGFRFLDYRSERTHFEEDIDGSIPAFQDLTFTDELLSIGAGVNVKLGVIYAIDKSFFVSLSGQTPTWYAITDTYSTSLEYAFDSSLGGDVFFDEVEPTDFQYRYTSPWKANAGVGLIIGRRGFLSGEIEYINYSNNQFDITRNVDNSITQAQTEQTNGDIDQFLTSAINIRVGGELAVDKLRFRAGIGLHSSPFNDSNEGFTAISLGVGYRINKFFADFGVRGTFRNEIFFPYFTFAPPQPIIDNQNLDLAAVLSIGTKF